MNYIVCSPEVANLLNLKPTPTPRKDDKDEQKSNFMDSQVEILEDSIQNGLFNYKATEYFGKY